MVQAEWDRPGDEPTTLEAVDPLWDRVVEHRAPPAPLPGRNAVAAPAPAPPAPAATPIRPERPPEPDPAVEELRNDVAALFEAVELLRAQVESLIRGLATGRAVVRITDAQVAEITAGVLDSMATLGFEGPMKVDGKPVVFNLRGRRSGGS